MTVSLATDFAKLTLFLVQSYFLDFIYYSDPFIFVHKKTVLSPSVAWTQEMGIFTLQTEGALHTGEQDRREWPGLRVGVCLLV